MTDKKQYTPRPDSAPARVIAHLQQHGGIVDVAEVAAIIGRPAASAIQNLQGALKSGLLIRHPDSTRSRVLLALGDGVATAAPEGSARARRPKVSSTAKKRSSTKASAKAAPVAEPVLPPSSVAALFEDGDIVLYELAVNADGETAIITTAHARRLHAFLGRVLPAEVAAA